MSDPDFYADLDKQSARRVAEGLSRELGPLSISKSDADLPVAADPADWINCASNDYLALARHPALTSAAVAASQSFGTGATASRLIMGDLPIHRQVEAAFTRLKAAGQSHADDAYGSLLLPTGYMANLAAITGVVGKGDLILLDRLVHASLIDAARLSGAEVRRFPHLDLTTLSRQLHRKRDRYRRCLLVTDAVFSMDGDVADLPGLARLADQHRCLLLVDEAHGTGVLGPRGAGLAEAQGLGQSHGSASIDLSIATGSKALGGLGGIITAQKSLIEHLINTARALIYTTGCPPAQAAALLAALEIVESEPERRERLSLISREVRTALAKRGWNTLPAEDAWPEITTPIIPLEVGENAKAQALSENLRQSQILAPAVRPPTVPPGRARVRLSLHCDLSDAQIVKLMDAIGQR